MPAVAGGTRFVMSPAHHNRCAEFSLGSAQSSAMPANRVLLHFPSNYLCRPLTDARVSETPKMTLFGVEIDNHVKPYLFWYIVGVLAITIVGIAIIPFFAIFYWSWYAPRYREYHTLELTDTAVESKRGVVFRSQTSVPLDRITDVAVHQGPLMRRFDIYKVTIESAGQAHVEGAASIIGVVDPYVFRDAVMRRVDDVRSQSAGDAAAEARVEVVDEATSGEQLQLLREIRDLLAKMESKS